MTIQSFNQLLNRWLTQVIIAFYQCQSVSAHLHCFLKKSKSEKLETQIVIDLDNKLILQRLKVWWLK